MELRNLYSMRFTYERSTGRDNPAHVERHLAVAALALSLVSFVLTYRAGLPEDRRSRMPVLVFIYDDARADGPYETWATVQRSTC
jgi:hypothetical protein